jgi:hypothetical protein
MFIRFIENVLEKFPDIETGEFVDVEACLHRWQHVAANSDGAVA